MSAEAIVRIYGAGARTVLANAGANHGAELGTDIAARTAWEAASYLAEAVGRVKAMDIIFAVGENIAQIDVPPPPVTKDPPPAPIPAPSEKAKGLSGAALWISLWVAFMVGLVLEAVTR